MYFMDLSEERRRSGQNEIPTIWAGNAAIWQVLTGPCELSRDPG